jgi:opacity protein-like surface antigen
MRNRSLVMGNAQTGCRVRKRAGASGIAALIACCGWLMPAAQAQSADEPNDFEITPFFGWMTGGGFEDPATGTGLDVESDTSYGIFLNMRADVPERQYELLYARQSTAVEKVAMDLDVHYLQIGGTVAYPQAEHVIPYFGATIGAAWFKPDLPGLDDETKAALSVGGGARFPITDHFGIRFDVRAFITLLQNDSKIFCVSDPANTSGCVIKPKSDTFIQYTGSLGVSFAF